MRIQRIELPTTEDPGAGPYRGLRRMSRQIRALAHGDEARPDIAE
jgi:hypothetical protein